jgi:hypothetical protein
MQQGTLGSDLTRLSELLHKYGHHGQGRVVDEILVSLDTPKPDYKRLAGVEMWGGSGAVWEVCLTPARRSKEAQADEKFFHETIIRIAAAMDRLRIGTERSRSNAKIFKQWLDEGII